MNLHWYEKDASRTGVMLDWAELRLPVHLDKKTNLVINSKKSRIIENDIYGYGYGYGMLTNWTRFELVLCDRFK